jgi:hypothetical protein
MTYKPKYMDSVKGVCFIHTKKLRVTAGAEFYALFKNASFVYVVYRVK